MNLGPSTQFVHTQNVFDLKTCIWFRQRLKPDRDWSIFSCRLAGSNEDLDSLASIMRRCWQQTRLAFSANAKSLVDQLGIHIMLLVVNAQNDSMLYVKPQIEQMDTRYPSFKGLKVVFPEIYNHWRNQITSISVCSHPRRNKALHDYCMKDEAYKQCWREILICRPLCRKVAELEQQYQSLRKFLEGAGHSDCPSFFYPTIQYGFIKKESVQVRFAYCAKCAPYDNANIRIGGIHQLGDEHHKFTSSNNTQKVAPFDHERYKKFLVELLLNG